MTRKPSEEAKEFVGKIRTNKWKQELRSRNKTTCENGCPVCGGLKWR